MSEWISLLQTFGLAVTVLAFVAVCLWNASGWTGENVVKPIVNRYLVLLDALIASISKQGDTLVKVGNVLERLGETLENMGQHTIKSMDSLEQIASAIGDIRNVKRITVEGAEQIDIHPRK